MNIEKTIRKSDIAENYRVTSGACMSVAIAINEVFGGTKIGVTKSRVPARRSIKHAVVKIDGMLYDGRGKVTKEQLYKEFIGPNPPPLKEELNEYFWEPAESEFEPHKGSLSERIAKELRQAKN